MGANNVSERISDQRRGETVDILVERLRGGILEGRFAPGQRLITRELTDEIGISRGPLREAFRRLAADGLIELVPNRGAVVRRLTRGEMRELFQIREALEGLAARLAAERIGEGGNKAAFEQLWREICPQGNPPPVSVFVEQNRRLHRAIVRIGGNEQLSVLIDNLQLPLAMFQLGRAVGMQDISESQHEHVGVAEAILAGTADGAESQMRAHLRRSAGRILSLPDSAFKPERGISRRRPVAATTI